MPAQPTLDLGALRIISTESAGNRVALRIYDPRRPDDGFRMELTVKEADLLAGDMMAVATQIINRTARDARTDGN